MWRANATRIVGAARAGARRKDDPGQVFRGIAAYNRPLMLTSLQTIRSLRWLACSVLAWFVLSVGVAVASPLVNPQAMELICSGSGAIKLMVKTDDGLQETAQGHTLDCPLCAQVGAPPSTSQALLPVVHPLAHALRPIPAAHIAARTAAPLPPRGPPVFS